METHAAPLPGSAGLKPKLVEEVFGGQERRRFMRHVLRDLQALEMMLSEGLFEEGARRIGVEQEMFLIDSSWHPTPAATELIEAVGDPRFTTELGLFNLEFNLDPHDFTGSCLTLMENDLHELFDKVRAAAHERGLDAVLTGILPTIRKTDLDLENMTPNPRYMAINEAMRDLRGGEFDFYIKGLDELMVTHDSIMVEACNASFQVHMQVDPSSFASMYNLSQVVAGPVLAAATNSPILFGRRLWAETRIALFQQSIDIRSAGHHPRETSPRVNFGNGWVKRSVVELYKEDIARFRALIGADVDEDPFEKLESGETPQLKALRMHNGTVYRWNRACYGITNGKPHLRIEYRMLPSGPSILDEVANAALWLGVMEELSARVPDVTERISFEQAKLNFVVASRQGLDAHLSWLDGEEYTATHLILDHLLPLAHAGLQRRGVDRADIERLLGVVERRVSTRMTGTRWILLSLAKMGPRGTAGQRFNALVAATVSRQNTDQPVSEWELAKLDELGVQRSHYLKVDQYMQNDVVTVHPEDGVDLVANLMEWERIRHIPVEDHQHRLVGLVSYRALLRLLSSDNDKRDELSVADIMKKDPVTVSPSTTTVRAIEIMREYQIAALPVVYGDRLVGLITESDLLGLAADLLELET